MEEYNKWALEQNSNKTKYKAIGCPGKDLNLDEKIIKNTREYKCLRVTLTEVENDKKHILQIIGKGKTIKLIVMK